LLKSDQVVIKDLVSIHVQETSIVVISYSTTVVTRGDESNDCRPWDWSLGLVRLVNWFAISHLTEINGKEILAYQEVRVIESVLDVPTERFELFTLDEDGVEPGKTVDSLSEFSVSVAGVELRVCAI
jgi:hypothetical protein